MKKLSHLVIKPTYACNQHCPYCLTRKNVFAKSEGDLLSWEDWVKVLHQADDLGNLYLDISGGEPTLYAQTDRLIFEAKKRGWYVSLNTNGTCLSTEMIKRFEDAGLDRIIISCISLDGTRNDRARSGKQSVEKIEAAVKMITRSSIRCGLHCIVCRYNYSELDRIMEYCFKNAISSLSLIYPENACADKSLSLDEGQIKKFTQDILPALVLEYTRLYTLFRGSEAPSQSQENLKGLYRKDVALLSRGIYQPCAGAAGQICSKPGRFALVLANGVVFPCNGIEYVGQPIIGNVRKQSLRQIWQSPQFSEWIDSPFDFCRYCPIPDHTGLAIMDDDIPPYTREISRTISVR